MGLVAGSTCEAALRSLPSVDEALRCADAGDWLARLPREKVVGLVREAVADLRADLLAGRGLAGCPPVRAVAEHVGEAVERLLRRSLRPTINASGVILHTNLGRAPLSEAAIEAIRGIAGRYCNLEYDAERGRRGRRDIHCGALLEKLLGAPAIVVNNNAAAIFLALRELAADGSVVISRGELVEIGDGFRIPEIIEASQTALREVGATNRTRIEDYRLAIGPDTRALLRVHPSNFRLMGFTGRPALRELVALAREAAVPLIEDLGSGCLTDSSEAGIEGEPPVTRSLRAGVDIVTFSGDKLLGGPQAGIIAGRSGLVARIRRNPLFRALRADKLALAALEATLRAYLRGREDEIPVLRMLRASAAEVAARAERFAERLGLPDVALVPGESLLGGGSTPMQGLPTRLVALSTPMSGGVRRIERRLRANDPPVVARIERDSLLVDLRTVLPDEEEELREALRSAVELERGAERNAVRRSH